MFTRCDERSFYAISSAMKATPRLSRSASLPPQQHREALGLGEPRDGRALRVEAQAGTALAGGRDTKIGSNLRGGRELRLGIPLVLTGIILAVLHYWPLSGCADWPSEQSARHAALSRVSGPGPAAALGLPGAFLSVGGL